MNYQANVKVQDETAVVNGDDVFRTFIDDADLNSKQTSRYVLPDDIKQALVSSPDVRIKKVDTIKQQFEDGTYDITDEKLEVVAQELSQDFRLVSNWAE